MQGYLFSRPVPFDEMTALAKLGQVPTADKAAA
jgi:EAL domain-containing protein (putative c-di-GMP-specific phosphodiesterase class I)